MQKRLLPALLAAVVFLIIIDFGCTKIDTTTLGSDLVTVDNINTFADTLTVNATQGFFTNDSTILKKTDNYIIGNINGAGTDPLFGKTTAAIYLQLKPTYYPFVFGTINAKDTVHNANPQIADFDSAFICLSYKGTYGDTSSATTIPQTFEVRQIADADFRDKTDTLRKLNYQPAVLSTLLGSATITPQTVKQKVYLGKGTNLDSVTNQIRIKFNTAAGITLMRNIYNQDSAATHPFYNDTLFTNYLNGFAITVNGPGNTIYYVNLTDGFSRLEFHYHKKKVGSAVFGTPGAVDTVVQSFQMLPVATSMDRASSSADYVKRDYSGAQILSPLANNYYIQASPGTYATLQIPGLSTFPNKIIHRAYLVVEQTPDVLATDKIYNTPPYLYLDLKDTSTAVPQRYKPVYFDLSPNFAYNPDATDLSSFYHPFPASNVDLLSFGAGSLERYDASGNPYSRYELNITRYVQHIVTNGYHNYDLRLYAPYSYYYYQYPGTQYIIPYYVPLADGRLRVKTGVKTDPKAMKLVIVYSNIP